MTAEDRRPTFGTIAWVIFVVVAITVVALAAPRIWPSIKREDVDVVVNVLVAVGGLLAAVAAMTAAQGSLVTAERARSALAMHYQPSGSVQLLAELAPDPLEVKRARLENEATEARILSNTIEGEGGHMLGWSPEPRPVPDSPIKAVVVLESTRDSPLRDKTVTWTTERRTVTDPHVLMALSETVTLTGVYLREQAGEILHPEPVLITVRCRNDHGRWVAMSTFAPGVGSSKRPLDFPLED